MSNNITINKKALEAGISKLQSIRNRIDTDASLTSPVKDIQGSGNTITLINEINKMYTQIADDFKVLVSNSAHFFENVLNSTSDADNKAEKYFK